MITVLQAVRRRPPRLSAALLVAVAGQACGGMDDSTPSRSWELQELVVPVAEGAGEPFVSSTGDGAVLSWLEPDGEAWALRVALLTGERWSEARTVVSRPDLFVNWADFPSVVALADGRLAAHWLQRGADGGYDYGVRLALSADQGLTWSEPWTPHEDGTPTEHGFVSLAPQPDGSLLLLWLDGRRYAVADGRPATDEMTLRSRVLGADGAPSAEVGVDDRVCDCCQTAMALTSDGWIAVYRDRTDDEVRDIYAARWREGEWSPGRPVHRDGWMIAACPVNGPQVSARGERVAVAWFTGAADEPRVQLALSDDAGERFGEPLRLDGGNPVGRVDVEMAPDGAALVTWIERAEDGGEVRLRRVAPDGTLDEPTVLARTSQSRAAGFPRTALLGNGDLLVAWTEVGDGASRVRVLRVKGGAS